MDELKPASLAKGPTYDPQGSGMDHDSVFKQVAPGSAASGNLKYKWNVPNNHTGCETPPSNLKGD